MYVQRNIEERSQIIVAEKMQNVLHISVHACVWMPGFVGVCMSVRVCSLAYPACNAYTPYCNVICGPLWLHYFSTFSHKQRDLKNLIEYKICVLSFFTTSV
jgi:hypothetical protein